MMEGRGAAARALPSCDGGKSSSTASSDRAGRCMPIPAWSSCRRPIRLLHQRRRGTGGPTCPLLIFGRMAAIDPFQPICSRRFSCPAHHSSPIPLPSLASMRFAGRRRPVLRCGRGRRWAACCFGFANRGCRSSLIRPDFKALIRRGFWWRRRGTRPRRWLWPKRHCATGPLLWSCWKSPPRLA